MTICAVSFALAAAALAKAPAIYHCPVDSGRGYGYTQLKVLEIKFGEGISCSYAGGVATRHSALQKAFSCHGKTLVQRAHYYDKQVTCTAKFSGQPVWVRWVFRQRR